MSKISDIEEEMDEPFDDVIRGFAMMGYSRRAVAGILEFNLSYFRQILTKRDLHKYFKKQKDMREECRSGGNNGWWKGKKRKFNPRYSDSYLLELVNKYPHWADFMTMAPVSFFTVTRRFKIPWREIVTLAQAELAALPSDPELYRESVWFGGEYNRDQQG